VAPAEIGAIYFPLSYGGLYRSPHYFFDNPKTNALWNESLKRTGLFIRKSSILKALTNIKVQTYHKAHGGKILWIYALPHLFQVTLAL
jgi:hypothetical protein